MVRYAGKRLTAKKIGKVIDRIPHRVYVEPMVGLGHVFFAKKPSEVEVLNDLDCNVVKIMKKEACKNPTSKKCKRLKNAKVTCGEDYRKVVRKYDAKDALIYLDPPYEDTKCTYKYCDVPTSDVVQVAKKAKGTVLISNDPKNRSKICGGKIKCRTIPFKFWGQPRKDLLAIKK